MVIVIRGMERESLRRYHYEQKRASFNQRGSNFNGEQV